MKRIRTSIRTCKDTRQGLAIQIISYAAKLLDYATRLASVEASSEVATATNRPLELLRVTAISDRVWDLLLPSWSPKTYVFGDHGGSIRSHTIRDLLEISPGTVAVSEPCDLLQIIILEGSLYRSNFSTFSWIWLNPYPYPFHSSLQRRHRTAAGTPL
jgi:hypothetical protein